MRIGKRQPFFLFNRITAVTAAALLLLAGALATAYQYRAAHIEHRRQLTVQATILAASVTAAIAFNDRATAQEYVDALALDPRLDAAAVYNEQRQQVAGFHRAGSAPIVDRRGTGAPWPEDHLLVEAPARQGSTAVGTVYLRATDTPLMVQLARYSGVALLTLMAVLMLSALAVAQRALTHANATLEQRARELADSNERLTAEMEQRASTEEALRQSQKMEAIGQLSGGIAHDFNNLLMIIKGSLTMLHKKLQQGDTAVERLAGIARAHVAAGTGQDAAQVLPVLTKGLDLLAQRETRHQRIRHHLDIAYGGIDRAASLTQRLLTFARRQPLSPKSLGLDALVGSMRPLLDHSVGSGVQIAYELQSRWAVLCDSNQMENAILNLVINARDAMPDGGQITLRTADVQIDAGHPLSDLGQGEYVHLCVQDTGSGMSEEVRRKAFDPFFTTKPVGKGTGLGLSSILGYVEQSGGAASIESAPGRGTTIHIVLPRARSEITPEVA
ncbi:MAG TPA: ATP-binding protein [Rhodanobacter sp.]|nr:ATP-binding protein [Rhodanobacter sp.]